MASDANTGHDWFTPVSDISPLVEKVREVALSRKTHSLDWRKEQIRAVIRLVEDHRAELADALHSDLGQGLQYAEVFEFATIINLANFALDHVDEWAKTKRVPTPFPTNLSQPVYSELTSYPMGLVLIMSPWNFPISLVLSPLINALSAGNACILKPSEISVHVSRLLTSLIPQYLDPDAVAVVAGGIDQATELLRLRYDVISYTGGTRVANVVAQAAARHLTPTLLELGGKTPAIICDDADIKSAARRIVWGKFDGNMGQFCINTDYCLVVEGLRDAFIVELKRALVEFYGDDPKESKDIGRMISIGQAKRVVGLVDSTCTILHGGTRHDVNDRYVEPTIVEASAKSTIMREEIFGPILAIVTVPDVQSAIKFVNDNFNAKGNHPLNMYVFAKGKVNQRKVMNSIQSGMCVVNHVLLNGGNFNLPFGGVGSSGMGAYYGKFGFDTFSHQRGALLTNNLNSSRADPGNWIIYPPHTNNTLRAFLFLGKVPSVLRQIFVALKIVAPILVAVVIHKNPDLVSAAMELNINSAVGWIVNLFSA